MPEAFDRSEIAEPPSRVTVRDEVNEEDEKLEQ
jgi:hypothetical protein